MKFITNNLAAITARIKGLLLFSQITAKLLKKKKKEKKSESVVTVGRTDKTECDSRIPWWAKLGQAFQTWRCSVVKAGRIGRLVVLGPRCGFRIQSMKQRGVGRNKSVLDIWMFLAPDKQWKCLRCSQDVKVNNHRGRKDRPGFKDGFLIYRH